MAVVRFPGSFWSGSQSPLGSWTRIWVRQEGQPRTTWTGDVGSIWREGSPRRSLGGAPFRLVMPGTRTVSDSDPSEEGRWDGGAGCYQGRAQGVLGPGSGWGRWLEFLLISSQAVGVWPL